MQKKVKIAVIILAVLLVLSLLALGGALLYNRLRPAGQSTVVVPDNLITPSGTESGDGQTEGTEPTDATGVPVETQPETVPATEPAADPTRTPLPEPSGAASGSVARAIYLHTRNEGDSVPFEVLNMFPGDVETRYYCIRVSHKGDVTVRFHADIRPGYEKLAEVLKCRIVLLTTGETMYDGLMRDMPTELTHELTASAAKTSELYYEITAYLETSVGNEYQLKELIADFRWWVEETRNLEPPKTGDVGVMPFVAAAVVSAFFLIILVKRRPKEEAENVQ